MLDEILKENRFDDFVSRLPPVTLLNTPVFDGPSAEWQHLVSRLGLSDSQRPALLAHPDGFSNEDYRRLNQLDRDQAYRDIHALVSAGIVLPAESSGRGAPWRISPDLRQSLAFLTSRTESLRQHFDRNPILRNAEYREMFGVTRHVALAELRRLVELRPLELRGERRGAHYAPGPELSAGPGPPNGSI